MEMARTRMLRFVAAVLALCVCLVVPMSAAAAAQSRAGSMSKLERKFVEQGLRLLPYDHPFVLAYEQTYGVDIKSYTATVRGVTVSGVPFQFGGDGEFIGFSDRWWSRTGDGQYPVGGLDCAEYLVWIYKQLGYEVPDSSTGLFFAGKSGVLRKLPGIREHYVIPSFEDALIGDVAYNSENYSYRSGHGSHTEMFLGTANKLGIRGAAQNVPRLSLRRLSGAGLRLVGRQVLLRYDAQAACQQSAQEHGRHGRTVLHLH
jgi:hypothetical protein